MTSIPAAVRSLILPVLVLLALAACDRTPGIEGSIDGPRALALMYAPLDAKLDAAVWKVTGLAGHADAANVLEEGGEALVSIALAQRATEGDQERFYLGVVMRPKPAANGEAWDCETCAPVIGITVFVRHDSRWALESHQPFVGTRGWHGGGPAMSLAVIGPGRHGVVTQTDWFHQGRAGTHYGLWTREEGNFAERFSVQTKESNEGNCSDHTDDGLEPCQTDTLEIAYQPGPLPDRYDIQVRTGSPDWAYDEAGHTGPRLFRLAGNRYVVVADAAEAERQPWPGKVPDNDPVALVRAFIEADAWGLQSSSEHWPLVQQFAVWQDGPGWDVSALVESAEIVSHHEDARRAEVVVVMRKIGDLNADGDNLPVIETGTAGTIQRRFVVINQGTAAAPRWRIAEPQDGPHLAVDFVLQQLLPGWADRSAYLATPAYRLLRERQAACSPSPIRLNRICRGSGQS